MTFKKGHPPYSGSFKKGYDPRRISTKGRIISEEEKTRRKARWKKLAAEGNLGGLFEKGHGSSNTGRTQFKKGMKQSPETIRKSALARIGKRTSSANPFWKGGVTAKNYSKRVSFMNSFEYREWRKAVFTRDNYTCQVCGVRGGELQADHELPYALFPDLRLEVLNGRTLCKKCHCRTDTYGGSKSPWYITVI